MVTSWMPSAVKLTRCPHQHVPNTHGKTPRKTRLCNAFPAPNYRGSRLLPIAFRRRSGAICVLFSLSAGTLCPHELLSTPDCARHGYLATLSTFTLPCRTPSSWTANFILCLYIVCPRLRTSLIVIQCLSRFTRRRGRMREYTINLIRP